MKEIFKDISVYKDILILLWSSDLSNKYLWFPARILIQLACHHSLLNTLSANRTAIDTGTLPIPCGSSSKKKKKNPIYLPLWEMQSFILYRFQFFFFSKIFGVKKKCNDYQKNQK